MRRLQVRKHPARVVARLNVQQPLQVRGREAGKDVLPDGGVVGVDEGVVQAPGAAGGGDARVDALRRGADGVVVFGVLVGGGGDEDFFLHKGGEQEV